MLLYVECVSAHPDPCSFRDWNRRASPSWSHILSFCCLRARGLSYVGSLTSAAFVLGKLIQTVGMSPPIPYCSALSRTGVHLDIVALLSICLHFELMNWVE